MLPSSLDGRVVYWLSLGKESVLHFALYFYLSLTQYPSFTLCQIWGQSVGGRKAVLDSFVLTCTSSQNGSLALIHTCNTHTFCSPGLSSFPEKTGSLPVLAAAGWLIYRELTEQLVSCEKSPYSRKGTHFVCTQ